MADIFQMTIFEPDEETPQEVEQDVRALWADNALGNDRCFYSYDKRYVEDIWETEYPDLFAYLESKGIEKCWIRYWW